MRRHVLATLIVLVAFLNFPTFAQTADSELAVLRAHLNLDASVTLELSDDPSIPIAETLRVFIATGLDTGVRRNLRAWIESWTKRNAKRYGGLELCDDSSNADIILVRYVLRDQIKTAVHSSTNTVTTLDIFSGKLVQTPVAQTFSSVVAPAWSYIIRRQHDRYQILWRTTGVASLGEGKKTGEQLFEGFKTLLQSKPRRLR